MIGQGEKSRTIWDARDLDNKKRRPRFPEIAFFLIILKAYLEALEAFFLGSAGATSTVLALASVGASGVATGAA